MIAEFSVEAMEEWGNGVVDCLCFDHCAIQVVLPKMSLQYDPIVKVFRNQQFKTGEYNVNAKNWKLKALIDAFKHFDTEEDKAILAQLITLRMTQS